MAKMTDRPMAKIATVILSGVLMGAMGGGNAYAWDEEEDMVILERTISAGQPVRSYVGGREEQDLEVQDALPQPQRSISGFYAGPSDEEGD